MATGRRRTSVVTGVVTLGFAGLLGYLAVPPAVAGLLMFEGKRQMVSMRKGRLLPIEKHRALIRSQEQAMAWRLSGEALGDLAYTRLVMRARLPEPKAGATPGSANGAVTIADIQDTLKRGLAIAPIQPDGWRWLARTRLTESKDRRGALAATRMSVYTGPYVPYLAIPRVALSLELWDMVPETERSLVYQQIRFAWAVADDELVKLAAASRTLAPFQVALSQTPRDVVRFELDLIAYRKKQAAAAAKRNSAKTPPKPAAPGSPAPSTPTPPARR